MTLLTTSHFPAAKNANYPAFDVEVAFGSLPTEGPIWRTIASDVRGLSVTRGRPREFDRFSAGRMTATLDNNARDFDPEYSSSPHYGHVLPEKRVRVLASYGGTQYVVFDGFVDGWPQEWRDAGKDALVQLSATDGFKVLAQAQLSASPWDTEVLADSPLVWHKLGDFSTGATMLDSSGNGYHGTYSLGGASIAGLVAESLDAATDFDGTDDYARLSTNLSVGTYFPSSATAWTLEGWFQTTQTPASRGMMFCALDPIAYDSYAGAWIDSLGRLNNVGSAVNDGAIHHFAVVRSTISTVTLYIDGASAGTPGTLVGNSVDQGGTWLGWQTASGNQYDGTLDEIIIYDRALAAERILAHYNAGVAGASGAWGGEATGTRVRRILDFAKWPGEGLSTSADRDLDTGSSTCAPASFSGSALDYLQTIYDTEQGQMYMGLDGALSSKGTFDFVLRQRHALITASRSNTSQATFSDSGSLRYADLELAYDETKVYNEARVTRSGGAEQTAQDTGSQTKFFRRTYEKSGLLYSSDNDSFDHATWAVNRYADPATRVESVIIKPLDSPSNLWPQVLGREIGDRITVTRNSISKEVIIEGIEHDYDGEDWTTTFRCSPADLGPYWLLDDSVFSVLDTSTILAF